MQQLLTLLEAEKRRRSFWEYCIYCDPAFFSKRPFLKDIADAMQRVADGQIKTLAICLPPRAGKSRMASFLSAWMLGKYPSGSVMRNTCTAKLYNKFSYDTKYLMLDQHFQDTFPGVVLQEDKQSLDGWNTTRAKQVSYFGAGVGGTIIGFGASLLAITDDLFKGLEDAMSETVRESTWRWYEGSHRSRLESGCPCIDIGTRWTINDVIGQNIEAGYYDEVIKIPALTIEDKSFCEDVKTTEEYLQLKDELDPSIWDGEFMQEPIEAKGILFSKKDLKRFSLKTYKERLEQKDAKGNLTYQPDMKLGYIDVADEGDDFLAFPVGYIHGRDVYIVDFIFTQDNIDITVPLCAAKIKEWSLDYVRVETNNQGGGFARDLKQLVPEEKILKVKSIANKHTRILMESGFIRNNFHFINEDELPRDSVYRKAMEQLCGYQKTGDNKHDDSPDAMAGEAKFIQSMIEQRG